MTEGSSYDSLYFLKLLDADHEVDITPVRLLGDPGFGSQISSKQSSFNYNRCVHGLRRPPSSASMATTAFASASVASSLLCLHGHTCMPRRVPAGVVLRAATGVSMLCNSISVSAMRLAATTSSSSGCSSLRWTSTPMATGGPPPPALDPHLDPSSASCADCDAPSPRPAGRASRLATTTRPAPFPRRCAPPSAAPTSPPAAARAPTSRPSTATTEAPTPPATGTPRTSHAIIGRTRARAGTPPATPSPVVRAGPPRARPPSALMVPSPHTRTRGPTHSTRLLLTSPVRLDARLAQLATSPASSARCWGARPRTAPPIASSRRPPLLR